MICKNCANNEAECDCVPCRECCEFYAFEDIKNGFCPDCHSDYDEMDLEDKFEKLFNG